MFDHKLVVITGGSSGIGKQLAADFLRAGARVIIVSEKADRLTETTLELSTISKQVASILCDVNSRDSVQQMVKQVLQTYGCPDILVNNAGFATYRTFENTDLEEIERLMGVNLMGAVRCTRLFLPQMIERRSGTIVNMASIAGRLILTPNGVYCAAKHALVAWSEVLKYELTGFNIQVHVICPGRVEQTAFFEHETFRTRAPRRETRYTIRVKDVSKATLRAITRKQFLTYVPWPLGMLVWLINTLPFLVKPIYRLLMLSRIHSIYAQDSRKLRQSTEIK